jgi:FkbM family methyltransferase
MKATGILKGLKNVENLARATKFQRLRHNPVKYLRAIGFRDLFYARHQRSKAVVAPTFFGVDMHLLLPASTDIYLTGGKTHDSEIRLAHFLINQLQTGDVFVDVGAHYGYFSLLAAQLVGPQGQVFAFEAAPATFRVLQQNFTGLINAHCWHQAVADTQGELVFYEFPNLYSEYNALDINQFKDEDWYATAPPTAVTVAAVPLGDFFQQESLLPQVIKIDVEGAEYNVIKGMQDFLAEHPVLVVMEYLAAHRSNDEHVLAEKLLRSLGYDTYLIDREGQLAATTDIGSYLETQGLESDNVVFKKKESLHQAGSTS